jgi:putative membrane protein
MGSATKKEGLQMYKYVLATTVVSLLLVGCEKKSPSPSSSVKPGGTGSTAMAPEHSTTRPALQGENQGPALSDQDRTFLREATHGSRFEVQLGEIAGRQAHAQDVRSFGQRMVRDHGQIDRDLASLAERKGVEIPSGVGNQLKGTIERLSGMEGGAFDRSYMEDMVADHEKDIAAFRKEAQNGQDPDVKAFAEKTVKTLETHLHMAREASGKVQQQKPGKMEEPNSPATKPSGV